MLFTLREKSTVFISTLNSQELGKNDLLTPNNINTMSNLKIDETLAKESEFDDPDQYYPTDGEDSKKDLEGMSWDQFFQKLKKGTKHWHGFRKYHILYHGMESENLNSVIDDIEETLSCETDGLSIEELSEDDVTFVIYTSGLTRAHKNIIVEEVNVSSLVTYKFEEKKYSFDEINKLTKRMRKIKYEEALKQSGKDKEDYDEDPSEEQEDDFDVDNYCLKDQGVTFDLDSKSLYEKYDKYFN